MYFEPNSPAEGLLQEVHAIPTNFLEKNLPELGRGQKGIVLHGGTLALKRCVSGVRDTITGLPAVAANVALATALNRYPYEIGKFRLLGCMPRGYFEPDSPVGHPTWVMDFVEGENAQDMIGAPQEATEANATARDALCRMALQEAGIDPQSVFLDTVCPNAIVNTDRSTITVIDAMAPIRLLP